MCIFKVSLIFLPELFRAGKLSLFEVIKTNIVNNIKMNTVKNENRKDFWENIIKKKEIMVDLIRTWYLKTASIENESIINFKKDIFGIIIWTCCHCLRN